MKPTDKSDFTNKYARYPKSKVLQKLMTYPIAGLVVHWIFQGLLYMDNTERNFKIAIDIILITFLYFPLRLSLNFINSILLAIFIAHSINFIFNGQIWVLLKHYGYVHHSVEEFEQFIIEFKDRVNREQSIQYAAVFGSRVRSDWRTTSDLDVRIIRHKGISSGIRACIFILKERTQTVFSYFPLDIFLLDNFERLNTFPEDEKPLVLKEIKSN